MDGSQQKYATKNVIVYRAGNKFGPSFDLKDESINEVWLFREPKVFFQLLGEVCLWKADLSDLRKLLRCDLEFEEALVKVKLKDSRNSTEAVKEIQTHLRSLVWQRTTAPPCEKGFPLLCNPLTHAVEEYMNNHLPTTSMELNFHAGLKVASKWRWSGERLSLDIEESLDGRRKIAAKEILKYWKELEAQLLLNERHTPNLFFSCPDYSGYIQVLEKKLRMEAEDDLLEVEMPTVNDEEQSAISYSSAKAENDSLEVEMATVNEEEQLESAIGNSSDTLVPQQLVISGEENDPLGGTFRTMYSAVYERLLFCSEEPPLMDVDFLLDHNGQIIPSTSCGLLLSTDFENLPPCYQKNPERLWKLNNPQMYHEQIEIARLCWGQYVIKPKESVELETFKNRLRCLRWVKMSSF